MKQVHLVVIDPQRDFCDPHGSLFVPGADEDMKRLAKLVQTCADRLADIHVTLDSHRKVDISHPIWWRNSTGDHPDPFTTISVEDVEQGRWTTFVPAMYDRSLQYLRGLEAGGRYPHVIWPYHCLIGDEGHALSPEVAGALQTWEERFAVVDFITKGSNPWTEHFSGVQAEVPDPEDPTTQLNTGFIDTLQRADVILMAGEALSHCLANTVRDIITQFSAPDLVSKIHLLTDASSPVTGFEPYADDFLRDMTAVGMQTTTTSAFIAA
jgi:nicotinamidase-related amidase